MILYLISACISNWDTILCCLVLAILTKCIRKKQSSRTSESKNICDPCDHNGKNTLAEIWCSECEERLCQECVKVHNISNLRKNHNLIPIDGYDKETQVRVEHICEKHGQKFVSFCPQHDIMLCFKCIQSYHISCDVTELEEAAKGIKSSHALTDVQDTVQNILNNIEKCNKVCIESENVLIKDQTKIKLKINRVRNNFNKVLDNLQEQLTQISDIEYKTRQRKMHNIKANLTQMKKRLEKLQMQMSTLTTSSELHTFVGLKMVQKLSINEEISLKDMLSDIAPKKFKLEINQKLQSFFKDLDSFGKITTETELQSLQFIDIKNRQAQQLCPSTRKCSDDQPCSTDRAISPSLQAFAKPPSSTSQAPINISTIKMRVISSTRDISKMNLSLHSQFLVKSGYNDMMITSCVILPNKKLVFADAQNKRLIVYTSSGRPIHFIKLKDQPFDMAILNAKQVVVTYRFHSGFPHIDVVDIYSHKQSSFTTDEEVQAFWGISHSDDKAIFTIAFPLGIQRIDVKTKDMTTIPINPNKVFNISVHNSKIYFTKKDKYTLCCCDTSGNELWKFQDEAMRCSNTSSISLTIDEDGNVYVVGMLENYVMLVSDNGRNMKIILDESDKLDKPRGIYYDKVTKQLLVCNQDNGLASLYDVEG